MSTLAWIGLIGAVMGYVFGGTGIIVKLIELRKLKTNADSKVGVAKITGDVELAKIEREHTGRFQAQLLDQQKQLMERLALLEQDSAKDADRIYELEKHNDILRAEHDKLFKAHSELLIKHGDLQRNHETLQIHVTKLEADNRDLRAKMGVRA